MKTFEFRPHVHGRPKSKIILIMKICTFILLVFNLGLSASGYSQQKKVTLDFKNATSKEFFAEIQKQTGYCFIFNTNQGEQIGEITISVRDKSVQEVMEEILRPTGFSYTFQNDIIVITPKMAEPEKNILTGLVFDENKQPLPGVTVLVKGSSNGVTTNTKGEFSIKLQEKDTLVFSFIGMESVTLPYTGQKTVTITLKSSKKRAGRSGCHGLPSNRETQTDICRGERERFRRAGPDQHVHRPDVARKNTGIAGH